MLISKTVCPAGSLLYIIPTGLQVVLHYNVRGNLSNIYLGFDKKVELDEEFMKSVLRRNLIPNAVQANSGATEIYGVFYSDTLTCDNGVLPECEYDNIKSAILSGNPGYNFYVGKVVTGTVTLLTSAAVITWCAVNNFKPLTSWLVSEDVDDNILIQRLKDLGYLFSLPHIVGYIIYEGTTEPYYYSTNLRTAKITKAKKFTESNGYIKYKVSYGEDKEIILNYPDAVNFNLQEGSQVLLDRSHIIWSSTVASTESNRLSRRITCEFCHKILDVPEFGAMSCSDSSCTSLLYSRIEHFCSTLDLKIPSYSAYKKLVKDNVIQILPDILLLPEYSEVTIEKHLWQIIKAVIPAEIGISDEWLIKFCNKCNNSYSTVKYYLEGPLRIATELDLEVPIRFGRWLSESKNLVELDTIVSSSQISYTDTGSLVGFDAPLLFLHKTIYITGVFKHGNTQDIITILQSYGATVVTDFDEFINYVVVGDIKENIDGEAIQGARALNIPVVDENYFFSYYGIDQDLENNLV